MAWDNATIGAIGGLIGGVLSAILAIFGFKWRIGRAEKDIKELKAAQVNFVPIPNCTLHTGACQELMKTKFNTGEKRFDRIDTRLDKGDKERAEQTELLHKIHLAVAKGTHGNEG